MAAFNFPNSPSNGQTHTENGVTFVWDGTAWKKNPASLAKGQKGAQGPTGPSGSSGSKGQKGGAGSTPIGLITAWSGSASSLPSGYLLCNGAAVSRTTYAALYAVVGTTHGNGNGSTTFNLPNLTDKFVVGADTSTGDTTYPGLSVGGTGGSATSTLPAHYHNFPGDDQLTAANGVASWSNTTDGNFSYDATSTLSGGGKLFRTTTQGTASTSTTNLPPYYALAYIIQFAEGGAAAKGQKGEAGPAGGPAGPAGPPGPSGTSNITQKIVSFTSNGTYTPTSGTKNITVYCVAGGGGSGGAEGDTSGEQFDFSASAGAGGGGACIGYYNITGSFSGSVQIGSGGNGGSGNGGSGTTGGESKFTPSGSYTGNGTLNANGGGGSGFNSASGGGGGTASGGLALTGLSGNPRSGSTRGTGGAAGFVFGTRGQGSRGAESGEPNDEQNGTAGTGGIVVIYEYII